MWNWQAFCLTRVVVDGQWGEVGAPASSPALGAVGILSSKRGPGLPKCTHRLSGSEDLLAHKYAWRSPLLTFEGQASSRHP